MQAELNFLRIRKQVAHLLMQVDTTGRLKNLSRVSLCKLAVGVEIKIL